MATAYQALRKPRHELRCIRGLDIHLTRWGPEPASDDSPVFLLHGFEDSGETFQFLVDALAPDWPLVALDWRGFGRSEWSQSGYWFPDYYADLDELLEQLTPHAPARLIGHSMGGNIAMIYAGLRADRVRCVVSLEGLALPRTTPQAAAAQTRKWLAQVRSAPPLKTYESFEQLTAIIAYRYPRFSAAQAQYVARVWARAGTDGRVQLWGDPRHRWVSPTVYKREDTEAIWGEITAPVLMLCGTESGFQARLGADGTDEALRARIPRLEVVHVAGAGHMLHIERPHAVAASVESFLRAH